MTRRLLFDQNLAPRLVGRVAAEFPGSLHVRDLELHAATDLPDHARLERRYKQFRHAAG